MRILPVDNLHQRKNTVWTQKFLRNYKKYLFTKSCLKVYRDWMLVFLNSCGRIDANKCRCKSCLQSILQLYLANILFHFLWLVGWIVTLSSIAALIVGTKYRNIPQTVIKSHKNVQIGNFQDSGQILAFSTFQLKGKQDRFSLCLLFARESQADWENTLSDGWSKRRRILLSMWILFWVILKFIFLP